MRLVGRHVPLRPPRIIKQVHGWLISLNARPEWSTARNEAEDGSP
jgi:hypothetical protein